MASLGGGAAKLGAGDNSDDIELALAATEDMNGHSAFALSPGLAPETNGDSERQGLRSGAYSAPLKKEARWAQRTGGAPGMSTDRWRPLKVGCYLAAVGALAVVVLGLAASAFAFGRQNNWGKAADAAYAGLDEEGLHFYVIGDWGRQGTLNQSEVAELMGELAFKRAPEFVISTGDNFYQHGLSSTFDDNFRISYMDVYNATSLAGIPWHAVLGNHDYGETNGEIPTNCPPGVPCFYSPIHELDVGLPKRDPRWHCERSFQMRLASGAAELFFIDTNPFISGYHNVSWANQLGGINQQSWQSELKELEAHLALSTAPWKIVIGHHPVFSSGSGHGGSPDLITNLKPVLEQYGAQAYMCGHDHHLEYLHDVGNNLHYIISGAGSQVRPVTSMGISQWAHFGSGFAAVTLQEDDMQVDFYGILQGTELPLYSLTIPRTA